ncbi:hypothetical protein [Caminibacter sp.]
MSRRPSPIKKSQVTVTLDHSVAMKIEEISKKLSLNRSQTINNLLSIALMDYDLFDKTGLISFVRAIKLLSERLLDKEDLEKLKVNCE